MFLQYMMLFAVGFGISMIIFWSRKQASQNLKWLLLTVSGATVSVLMYYLEMCDTNLVFMQMVHNMAYIFKSFTLLSFLMFLYHYCDIKIEKKAVYGMMSFSLVLSVMTILNHFHELVYTPIEIGKDFIVPYLKLEPNIMYYVFSIGQFLLMVFGAGMIIRKIPESNGIQRKRNQLLAMVVLLPISALILQIVFQNSPIDFVILALICCMGLLLVLTKTYGLLDTVVLAKENIMDNTKEGLIVVDTDFNVLYANSTIIRRYPAIMNMETEQEKEGLVQLIKEGEGVYRKDGLYVEIRVSDIREGNILRGYLVWTFDMSFLNEYTNEILHLKDKAEKADEEKTAFLANVSREIRIPMNTIVDFSELILQQKNNPPLTQEYAFDIRRSAKKLLHLMNDVLDVSKIETGKVETNTEAYYTQSLLEEVSNTIANQAKEKGLEYYTNIDSMLPYRMKGTPIAIREILTNIMNNAVKYTSEGSVSLDVHSKWRTETQIQIEIVVTDTGIGMKEKDVEQIFEKVSQLDAKGKRRAEGAGLGIAIVKGLIEQIDGDIQVESEYGKGTKIVITFIQEIVDERPIGEVDFILEEAEEKEFHQAFITTAKILVVDDNEVNIKAISGLLQKYDIEADSADSGYMAIDVISQKDYDVIFMDHMMPGMDGVETMLRIREMDKGTHGTLPIVALTTSVENNIKEDMMMLGFDGCLSKPVDINKLEKMLLEFIPKNKISYINANIVSLFMPESNAEEEKEEKTLLYMDAETGIKNCGGTWDDYYQVMDVVQKYGSKRLKKLEQLVNEKDYTNYTIEVHGLKNTAENIGAKKLYQMALEHENAGKTGDVEYIDKNYQELLAQYDVVLKEIQTVRGKI